MLKSRLFWKFFLSMMFIVLLTVFLSIRFEHFVRKNQSPQIIQQTISQLLDFRDDLTLALEVEDLETLTTLLAENPRYSQQILIFDEYSNEILGREHFPLSPMQRRFNHRLNKEFAKRGISLETMVISDFVVFTAYRRDIDARDVIADFYCRGVLFAHTNAYFAH